MENNLSYATLEDVVRQNYATVVWTHKIQEKQGDLDQKKYHAMEVINIICALLTTAGVVGMFFESCIWVKLATALCSFATIFCGAYFKSFNVQETIEKHRIAAQKLLEIRNKMILLIAKIQLKNGRADELMKEYEILLNELHRIYETAPSTSNKAVDEATTALFDKQDYTFSDNEIDRFLPNDLRKDPTK